MLHHWTGTSDTTRELHWTEQMTSVMAQSGWNDKTDGTSGVATQTHTDEMAHR